MSDGTSRCPYVVQPWTRRTRAAMSRDVPTVCPTRRPGGGADDAERMTDSSVRSARQIAAIVNPGLNGWYAADGSEISDNGCVPQPNGLDEGHGRSGLVLRCSASSTTPARSTAIRTSPACARLVNLVADVRRAEPDRRRATSSPSTGRSRSRRCWSRRPATSGTSATARRATGAERRARVRQGRRLLRSSSR